LIVRVVLDTNIFISAFAIPGGRAEDAYLAAIRGRYELLTSIPILTETAAVLQRKFDWTEDKVRTLVQVISRTATVVKPPTRLHVVKDEADNRILECAAHARADFIVTGDGLLLALRQYEGIPIVTLADFLDLLGGPVPPGAP
jgi:putative PIN family toxin of toxin-antitoxin system